jgi:hypothetical protein
MKTLLAIIILGITASASAVETKQVCTPIKDQVGHVVLNKDGTAKQTCHTIKVHKKYDGTVVPTKAPAKTSTNPYGFDQTVQKRQKELIAAGAKITADGVIGPATRRAETEFGNLVPKK